MLLLNAVALFGFTLLFFNLSWTDDGGGFILLFSTWDTYCWTWEDAADAFRPVYVTVKYDSFRCGQQQVNATNSSECIDRYKL